MQWSEALAYAKATGWSAESWELDLLMQMDAAVESQIYEERERERHRTARSRS